MFDELMTYYLNEFQKRGEQVLKNLCNLKVPGDVVLHEYKKLPPIESLPLNEKKELWQYAKETYLNGNAETKLRFIRIVYCIGSLIN